MSMRCELTRLKKSSGDCLKLAKNVIQHLREIMLFLNYCIISGNAEALVSCGGKLCHLLIAYSLGNMYAKYYENPTIPSGVTAKNVGDVFETQCTLIFIQQCALVQKSNTDTRPSRRQ